MDREEAILKLRKNKLDMEHEELLQDRNVIVITETGIPITLINIIVATQLYTTSVLISIIVAIAFILGIVEWFRRQNNAKITNKRNEIDIFIRQLQRQMHQHL
jgi:hypothetical protein